jgi:lysozyme
VKSKCPPRSDEFVRFVDVSKWQGVVNWKSVHEAGARMAVVRVSDGTKHPDPYFKDNWQQTLQVGLIRGVYQYVRVNVPVRDQVRLLCEKLDEAGGLLPRDLPPVCDIEHASGKTGKQVLRFVLDWCDLVEEHLHRRPIIYTYPYFWEPPANKLLIPGQWHGVTKRKIAYPLWIAHYETTAPDVPTSWDEWAMWQSTGSGTFPGIRGHADLNVFDGSEDDLRALIRASIVPQTWKSNLKRQIGMNLRNLYTRG